MQDYLSDTDLRERFRKLIKALKRHVKTQEKISEDTGLSRTDISKTISEEGYIKPGTIAKRISQVESKYLILVKFNEITQDYDDLVDLPPKEIKKVEVNTVPSLNGFDFLTERIQKGVDHFCILDTWTDYLNGGGIRYVRDWFGKVKQSIRILILNPLCDSFRLRITSLSNIKLYDAQVQLLQSLENLLNIADDPRSVHCQVEVRLYEEIPALNAYILDNNVYYGHYLMDGLSQEFFFSHTEGKENYIVEQVKAHFDAVWNSPRTESITKDRIKYFRELTAQKNAIHYELGEKYCMYNFDELGENFQLQTSTLEINRRANTCTLTHTNRRSGEVNQFDGRLKVVGQGNTLFSFIQANFFLEMLIATPNRIKPAILQAVYIHSDSNRFPRGSFAFLTDAEQLPELFKEPSRYKIAKEEKYLNAVEKYLVYQRFSVLKFKRTKSTVSDLFVDTDDCQRVLQQFAESGRWEMVYPERRPEGNVIQQNDYLNALGTGEFWVEMDQNEGIYKAYLKTLHISDFEGPVNVIYIQGIYFLNCSILLSREAQAMLSINIRIGRNATELRGYKKGTYNIVYRDTKIGCGQLLIGRSRGKAPQHINPLTIEDQDFFNGTKFLQFKSLSSIIALLDEAPQFDYPGIYEVYTYGHPRNGSHSIIQSSLRIHSNGYAEFKGVEPHGMAYGLAQKIRGNLYLELKNSDKERARDRKGYFVIAINDTIEPKAGEVYTGVFVGLSRKAHLPLSKRVVMKYLGNDDELIKVFAETKEGIRINSDTPAYHELEKAIRLTISGRFNNYIGFQDFGKVITTTQDLLESHSKEINLSQVFLESAIYKALELSSSTWINDVVEMLRQACLHGLPDLDGFENRVKDLQISKIILEDKEYLNLKNRMKS